MENYLLSRIINGEATPEEKEEFYRNLGDNKEDEELFYELKSLWIKSSIPTNPASVDEEFEAIWQKIKPETASQRFRIGQQAMRIAAMLVVFFALGGVAGYFVSNKVSFQTSMGTQKYTATKGSVSIIELQDGTKIWLNSGSELTYSENYSKKQRLAELHGEAFFEVKHREKFPLLIKAGDITVRDLGTSFNIKAYPEDNRVETSLFEGSADILSEEGKPIADLKPGQSAVYSSENKDLKVESFSQNIISAWKDGKFVIRDQRLEDIFKELSRWYDVEFKFENDSFRDYRYNGSIRKTTTPRRVLEMLKLTTNFNYRIVEKSSGRDEIIIY
ncbi:MAG TPA: DUF4974 domain-containing protein [Prolixibacteraceae bacterium]|nr:DUF4974 domain-containing protein [Prolixibacteraceae bacterium]